MTFNKGDIIMPIQRTPDPTLLRHPAVVWDNQVTGNDDFLGIMLTSAEANRYAENVPMKKEHFTGFYKNTHFVNQVFCKFAIWGPFEKVGELTAEGIKFIEGHLSNQGPVPFNAYVRKKANSP